MGQPTRRDVLKAGAAALIGGSLIGCKSLTPSAEAVFFDPKLGEPHEPEFEIREFRVEHPRLYIVRAAVRRRLLLDKPCCVVYVDIGLRVRTGVVLAGDPDGTAGYFVVRPGGENAQLVPRRNILGIVEAGGQTTFDGIPVAFEPSISEALVRLELGGFRHYLRVGGVTDVVAFDAPRELEEQLSKTHVAINNQIRESFEPWVWANPQLAIAIYAPYGSLGFADDRVTLWQPELKG